MRKDRLLPPRLLQSDRRPESSSLERMRPSTHRATRLAPGASLARMAAASFSRAASIWAWEGLDGSRSSGSSTTWSLQ